MLCGQMYGCIEVMNKTAINMAEELFIGKLHETPVYEVSEETMENAQEVLNRAVTAEEKLMALSVMPIINFSQKNYLEAFFLVDRFLNDPIMTNQRAYLLLKKGRISQFLYEFNEALICYCRGLASHIIPLKIYFALWDGVSLCLLYKQDFKQAELCCRRVIELDSNQWQAWKYLGVSLEHQGYFIESLEAHIKAVKLSCGNEMAILHLQRFHQRHPMK